MLMERSIDKGRDFWVIEHLPSISVEFFPLIEYVPFEDIVRETFANTAGRQDLQAIGGPSREVEEEPWICEIFGVQDGNVLVPKRWRVFRHEIDREPFGVGFGRNSDHCQPPTPRRNGRGQHDEGPLLNFVSGVPDLVDRGSDPYARGGRRLCCIVAAPVAVAVEGRHLAGESQQSGERVRKRALQRTVSRLAFYICIPYLLKQRMLCCVVRAGPH